MVDVSVVKFGSFRFLENDFFTGLSFENVENMHYNINNEAYNSNHWGIWKPITYSPMD